LRGRRVFSQKPIDERTSSVGDKRVSMPQPSTNVCR
jgi:hypothetical protein